MIKRRENIYAGCVQLYFGATPGTFAAPWIRDLTTSNLSKSKKEPTRGQSQGTGAVQNGIKTHGVFRIVPIVPPTVPDSKLFLISVALSYTSSPVRREGGEGMVETHRRFR